MTRVGKLRSGITTGASAAAAAQAAVLMLFRHETVRWAKIINPKGTVINVPIKSVKLKSDIATAVVIKDGGDDPDITSGLEITASVTATPGGIAIIAGPGVGRVTKPGLPVPVGEAAINPVPRQMITESVKQYIPDNTGVIIEISVPGGEEKARRTLNPKLGITGGISILGTTGIVEPMSEEAFKRSLEPQVTMAKALGYSTVCLTPGRLGERWAEDILKIPAEAIVQMSNFVGYMLNVCVQQGIKNVILSGHHSKITKVAAGCFHTHNKVSDARLETLAAYAGLEGAPVPVIAEIMEANTSEEALEILHKNNLTQIMASVASRAAHRAMEHVFGEIRVGVIMFTMSGEVLAVDANAREIGREMGWQIASALSE